MIDWWWLSLILTFGGLLLLMATGLPIAFCFIVINLVAGYLLWGADWGGAQVVLNLFRSISTFTLLPVPMFVLMGEVMFRSGLGMDMVDAVDKWLGRLPGRLGLVSVFAGTVLSATSGSTIATTALLGTVLSPEMEKRGYKKAMSLGPIMCSGGLAMLIPPSSQTVLLGSLADISIARLLIGGIMPGLMMAALFATYIFLRCKLQPSLAPPYEVKAIPLSEKIGATVRNVVPLAIIIFLVTGVILLGIATATEAAAMGALGCLVIAAAYKKLSWRMIRESITDTVKISVMVLFILAGAIVFSQFLAYSEGSKGLLQLVTSISVPSIVIFIVMQLMLVVLGCFMSSTAMIMIALPIYMPIVEIMGWNPVWFGLVTLVNMEVALISPPFGMVLFVMKSVASADTSMADVYKASIPFFIMTLVVIGIMIAFPSVTLWLPSMVKGG